MFMMTESFAGKINGKQKAIGFILLFPLYLYVIPRFANFGIYLLLKYTNIRFTLSTIKNRDETNHLYVLIIAKCIRRYSRNLNIAVKPYKSIPFHLHSHSTYNSFFVCPKL